jgi:hypothetical protein
MHPKFQEVIDSISKDLIPNYEVADDDKQIYFQRKGTNHHVYILGVVSGDVLRVDIRYIFALLDTDEITPKSVLELLLQNNGSFRTSSAYLSLTVRENMPIVSMQTYRTFLMKWPSIEIADQIELALVDISGAFLIPENWPTALKLLPLG